MKYTRSYFVALADELSATASHPEIIRRTVEVRKAPDKERIARGMAVYPEELRKLGIPLPETFRVSARTFENPAYAQANGVQDPGLEPGSAAKSSWESYGTMQEEAYDTSTWGPESEALPENPESPEVIQKTVHESVLAIADFVLKPPFYDALGEMYDLPQAARPQFVLDVFLNKGEMSRRGIVLPDMMSLQRSTFYDGRPTLFCITKKALLAYPWRKITITFDNDAEWDSPNDYQNIESVEPIS